jgi:AcrR family transcriptional regulator
VKSRRRSEVWTAPRPEALALPARQARSQRTQDRLISAAESLLREGGLDAATVPNIARRAGLAVGSVYRRFPDKDAVMRAVAERFLESARRVNLRALDSERWKEIAPEVIARLFVASIVNSYRVHGDLLRALILYASTHSDEGFSARFEVFNLEMVHRVSDIMLVRRSDYRHPRPDVALRLGLVTLTSLLQIMVISKGEVLRLLRITDAELCDELTGMFLRYVGLPETEQGRKGARAAGERLKREAREAGVEIGRSILFRRDGDRPRPRRTAARRRTSRGS